MPTRHLPFPFLVCFLYCGYACFYGNDVLFSLVVYIPITLGIIIIAVVFFFGENATSLGTASMEYRKWELHSIHWD